MGDLSCSDDVDDLLEQIAAWGTLLIVEDEAAVGLYVVEGRGEGALSVAVGGGHGAWRHRARWGLALWGELQSSLDSMIHRSFLKSIVS